MEDHDYLKAIMQPIKYDIVEDNVQAATTKIISSIPTSDDSLNKVMITENVLPTFVKMLSGTNLEGQANALGGLVRFTN